MAKFPPVVVLLCWTILIIADTQVSMQVIDPCNKPQFCTPDTKVPDPEDCFYYYWCVNGYWLKMNCSIGTLFDNVTLECTFPDQAHCQPECPPFTGSTTERVTLPPGTCENITQCVENQKYQDRSNCQAYYLCTGGELIPQTCPIGTVFDIYVADCVTPTNDFDCYYRCITPAPTTEVPVTVTSGSVTTDAYVTSGSSTSSSSTSFSGSSTITNTDSSGSGNEAVLIGIIIAVVVIIIIIVVVVICVKKRKKNKVDPETCCSSFFHRVHLYIVTGKTSKKSAQARRITVQDCHLTGVQRSVSTDPILPPAAVTVGDPGTALDFDHSAFMTAAERDKRKGLKRYKRINPSREEAIKATNKYKKKLRKQLQLRYEAEERHENGYYNDTLDLLNNDASVMRQNFHDDLRSASDRNDPTELTALANNHVNCQHANTISRHDVMNGRDQMLRTRLKDMHLTQQDMVRAGLLASDLDGSDVARRIRIFNEQQEKMEESYLQKFTSMATSGASLRDLEMLTESYESEMAALNETHLLERNQASQRLMKALNILALQNLDKLWNQECQQVDKVFDYSSAPDDDPGLVKETLAQHLDALKKAGEEVDSHIANRNLSVALATANNVGHDSATMETSARTRPLPTLPLTMETITDNNDDAGEFPNGSIAGTAVVNGIESRSMAPPLEEEHQRILARHQQQKEQIQAMRARERSTMDELLRKKLSQRKSVSRLSASDLGYTLS